MKRAGILTLVLILISLTAADAAGPRKWELKRIEQFLQGKFEGISVSYEGVLSLAPNEDVLAGPSEEFYLSFIKTAEGNSFLGTGHSGNIYRIDSDGKAELYFHVPEMDIYCLALDSRGMLYAGSSPNGRIYKISGKDQGKEFFNPSEKYIWDIEFMDDDLLLAAVGERGGIYSINRQGEGNPVLKAKENHILCLKKTGESDILAGSGGPGRLYRIPRTGVARVIYETPFEEIKSIALNGTGNIYIAAGGTVTRPQSKSLPAVTPPSPTDVTITVIPAGSGQQPTVPTAGKQPGALFKISPEGIGKQIWSDDEELIYALMWDPSAERLIFGTGSRGRLYTVDKAEKISLLFQKSSEQIYAIYPEDDKLTILANNPPVLSLMHKEQRFQGEYLSRVYDTNIPSAWGRIEWNAEAPSGTLIQMQTRSGNASDPSSAWSNWSPPYQKDEGEPILNPRARYIQFKIIFKSDSGRVSPRVNSVTLFYQQTNVAPELTSLEVLPVNVVFLEPPIQDDKIWGRASEAASESQSILSSLAMAKKVERKGFRTCVWQGKDDNEDRLDYAVYIRKNNEDRWRLLKEHWQLPLLTFETLAFPDGEYYLKIEASDGDDNPVGRELKTEKISRSFIIDNSLPVIRDFQATRKGNTLSVVFSTEDAYSRIKQVQFLIRPDEWRTLPPVDGICDSRQERFETDIPLPLRYDTLITIKVMDEHGNVGVHRAVFQ